MKGNIGRVVGEETALLGWARIDIHGGEFIQRAPELVRL